MKNNIDSLAMGPIQLGKIPRLVAIIDQAYSIDDILYLQSKGATILEIRLDSFGNPDDGLEFLKLLGTSATIKEQFGLLATHREDEYNQGKRLPVFEAAVTMADAIDIEYECAERAQLTQLAIQNNTLAMLSSHDFQKMPENSELEEILIESAHLKAHITKMAVMANSIADLQRLTLFTAKHAASSNLITIAMGEYGLLSRIATPFFGSLISYGFITAANAPGQLSLNELHSELLRYHPAYKKDYLARIN